MRNKFLLCNFVFVFSLIVLFLNDHFLKLYFHNWFTGKLSDVAGIILLPLLLSFLFPKIRHHSIYITGLFFTFWKSSYSEKFIEFYNVISPISIHRVVDYTDLLTVVFLFIPYYFITDQDKIEAFAIRKISPAFLFFPSILILMSTSPGHYYYYDPETGNVKFTNFDIVVDGKNKQEVIEEFKKKKILIHKDTVRIVNSGYYQFVNGKLEQKNLQSKSELYKINQDSLKLSIFREIERSEYYIIDSLKIGDEVIKEIKFYMYDFTDKKKGKSTGLNVGSLKSDKSLTEKKVERKLKKMYKEALKSEFTIN